MTTKNTCYGCKYLESQFYGDGTKEYFCTRKGVWIVVGEKSLSEYEEPTPIWDDCYEPIKQLKGSKH